MKTGAVLIYLVIHYVIFPLIIGDYRLVIDNAWVGRMKADRFRFSLIKSRRSLAVDRMFNKRSKELACKPGSVEDSHSSAACVATRL